MTEYTKEEVEELAQKTNTNIVEYQDIFYLIDSDQLLPLSDKAKLRIYSDYLRSEFYRNYEDEDTSQYDETIITNLLYVWVNEVEGVVEYDVVTKNFEVLNTEWIYLNEFDTSN